MALNRQFASVVLVALQFGLLAALGAAAAPRFMAWQVGPAGWLLLMMSIGLGLWSLACNRPGNFNIRPLPRQGGQLVQTGPYRWIRHPMYSAVLLAGAARAWVVAIWVAWFGLALLAGVLLVKATLEERWMVAQHPGYAAYMTRTRRFVPGLL